MRLNIWLPVVSPSTTSRAKNGMIVYLITNSVNGKVYVGKTENSITKRWARHVCDSRTKQYAISKAIRKYGAGAFSMAELARASTRDQLNELERKFIAQFCSNKSGIGYNCTIGGDGNAGHVLSAEGRRKVSDARKKLGTSWSKGKRLSKGHRSNIAQSLLGNHNSANRVWSDLTRKKLSENNARAFLGKHHSSATRKRISQTMKALRRAHGE